MIKPILEEKDILNPNEAIGYSYLAEESFISC